MKAENKKNKKTVTKLYFVLISLILAVVVLGGATFAWLTLSTNPELASITANASGGGEIRISTDNENYSMSKELVVNSYAALVPSSTVDGLNWFICNYDAEGNVTDEYSFLRFPDGANGTGQTPVKSTLGNATKNVYSYYIYTDIYLKSAYDKTDVYISMPSTSDYTPAVGEGYHYGTYVLGYNYDSTTRSFTANDNGANTAARLGFMVLGELTVNADGTTTESDRVANPQYYCATCNEGTGNRFVILEPNAETRSGNTSQYKEKEDGGADIYVAGFSAEDYTFTEQGSGTTLQYSDLDGYYLQTYPVRPTDGTKTAISELMLTGNETTAERTQKITAINAMYNSWVFKGQNVTLADGTTKVLINGQTTTFPLSNLIVQKTSTWDLTKIATLKNISDVDSSYVSKMGKFLITNSNLAYQDLTQSSTISLSDYSAVELNADDSDAAIKSSTKITTLYKDVPQKIRIYFWIEGQDVDCWNDIATTRFLANIEFVGDVITD